MSKFAAVVLLSTVSTLLAAIAPAQTFRVNSTADSYDRFPGDGLAQDIRRRTTLRAAIEEANTLRRVQTIEIPAGTYTLTEGPLKISQGVVLKGLGRVIIDGDDRTRILETVARDWAVCDYGGHTVKRFNSHGALNQTLISARSGGLRYPRRATVGPDDKLYVTGLTSGVHRYNLFNGAFETTLVSGSIFPVDHSFRKHSSGDELVVADLFANRVRRFNLQTGRVHRDVGSPRRDGMIQPIRVLSSSDRHLVAVAGAILSYDGQGRFVRTFASTNVTRPSDMAFGSDGDLFVSEPDGDCVHRYDGRTGAYKSRFIAARSGGLDMPTSIAFGSDGHLYVVSYKTKKVLRYNGRSGRFLGVFLDTGVAGLQRPFSINLIPARAPGQLTRISNVTFRNGNIRSVGGVGGGILNRQNHRLILERCRVEGCGSISYGSGICNLGTLQATDTAIVGNSNRSFSNGGGVTATGGGIYNATTGWVVLRRCLVANNTSVRGAGINNGGGRVDLTNTTISGNIAKNEGGGIRNQNAIGKPSLLRMAFCTVTLNEANTFPRGAGRNHGAGIWNNGRLQFGDCIIARNEDRRWRTDPDYSPDIYGPTGQLLSQRDNIVGVANGLAPIRDYRGGTPRFDRIGSPTSRIDPRLNTLRANGGPTMTHALLTGSPARDADRNFNGGTFWIQPSVDQRGYVRPAYWLRRGDVGAVEAGAQAPRR